MAITGGIINPGDTIDISYSGDIQPWEVPISGLYMLEVWGAAGGNSTATSDYGSGGTVTSFGGKGGYSVGYTMLEKGKTIYIVCGGAGKTITKFSDVNPVTNGVDGGYNGGGSGHKTAGRAASTNRVGAGGGGATHVATVPGVLSSLEDKTQDLLIVAGGGGGAACGFTTSGTVIGICDGGSGGGESGGDGVAYVGSDSVGGTQNGGYKFGEGKGAESHTSPEGAGGGGGGYYGGTCSSSGNGGSGGGGSGYIGGVPEISVKGIIYTPYTQNGVQSGNGAVKITLIDFPIKNNPSAYYVDNPIKMYLNERLICFKY